MQLTHREKLAISLSVYSTVKAHFAHWQSLGDFDFEKAFAEFSDEIVDTDDRRLFSLALLKLLAGLKNSHTDLYDGWLWDTHGQSFGFYARELDGQWVVTSSLLDEIPVGSIVSLIDGIDVAAVAERHMRYIPASSTRAAKTHVFFRRYLFPNTFDVTLDSGTIVKCEKKKRVVNSQPAVSTASIEHRNGVPVLRIPSFEDGGFEESAVQLINECAGAPGIVIDLRGNGGGNTPMDLIAKLMDRPYRMWTDVTNAVISSIYATDTAYPNVMQKQDLRALPYLVTPSPQFVPRDDAYAGRLVVLIDEYCFSAAEDFLLPLSQGSRATFVGSTTAGSTGQPLLQVLAPDLVLRVGAKRQLFPDGSPFEGSGHSPHVSVSPTVHSVREGRDQSLEVAIDLISSTP